MTGNKEAPNTQRHASWRLLAQQASEERDPEKLINLVLELNSVLQEEQRNYHICG